MSVEEWSAGVRDQEPTNPSMSVQHATESICRANTPLKQFFDEFKMAPTRGNAPGARNRIREGAAAAGLPLPAALDLEVAVGEAISNAILYGSPDETTPVVIRCYSVPDLRKFVVEVIDHGGGFEVSTARRAAHFDDVGGRGISIMQALVDDVKLVSSPAGVTVTLVKGA